MRHGTRAIGFDELIASVEGVERTLTLLNVEESARVRERLDRYFAPQNVTLESVETDDGRPRNVAILTDADGEFLAASDVTDLDEYVRRGLHSADVAEIPFPEVLTHVDDTTFIDYGKRRMILASREIERAAYRCGEGTVHAGFQSLGLVKHQATLYRQLAERGLDVHVYGAPDGEVPSTLPVTVHPDSSEEMRQSWFVAYDGPDVRCALLAKEVVNKTYRGFWSYRDSVVDRILTRVETYFDTASS